MHINDPSLLDQYMTMENGKCTIVFADPHHGHAFRSEATQDKIRHYLNFEAQKNMNRKIYI